MTTPAEKREAEAEAMQNYHRGHMWMAQGLRLIGALPAAERRAFVRGMIEVLSKWTQGQGNERWPVLPSREKTAPKPPTRSARKTVAKSTRKAARR